MKCENPHCRKKAKPGHHFCSRCLSRRWRENNPVRSSFLNLKNNAKRRKKAFDLTYEQFEFFAVQSGYMKKKGIYQQSWHIDRISEEKGYTIDNIQVLTNRQNVRKYLKYSFDQHGKPVNFHTVTHIRRSKTAGVPF